ncbi:MAG: flippase-like domain-containing protein [Candidatus Solibacter usitatus]|nr:flippase-like domain-containing protein [Candidatus Solibacter usitatus]
MLAVVTVGVFLIVRRLSTTGFDTSAFFRSISAADWRWLFAAWVLSLLSYYGRALRWMVMLRPLAPASRTHDVFSATVIGFSAVLLFGRPGEFIRPFLIARHAGVSFLSQLAAWLLERIYDTLTLLVLFGYALALVPSTKGVGPVLRWILEKGGWFTGVSCSVCLAALVALHLYADSLEQRLLGALGFLEQHHHEKAARIVRAAMDGFRSTRNARSVFLLFAYSALEWTIISLIFYAIFQAFPQTALLPWSSVFVYLGFVAFGSILQIPAIGGGVQIISTLVLTEFFHLRLEAAVGIALVSWVFTLVGILPVGVIYALHQGLTWRNIKDMEREAEL